jgi:hypothetical protein
LPRRRFVFALLFPCAVTAGGGTLFIVHECLTGARHAVPKPGPRRYPPGYRPKAAPPQTAAEP